MEKFQKIFIQGTVDKSTKVIWSVLLRSKGVDDRSGADKQAIDSKKLGYEGLDANAGF